MALPPLTTEPALTLKNVLYLRTEADVPAGPREELDALAIGVRDARAQKATAAEWLPIYERALEIVGRMMAESDAQVARLQAGQPTNERVTQLINEHVTEPKRQAEATRVKVKAALRKAHDEWRDRVQRQSTEWVAEKLGQAREGVVIRDAATSIGVAFEVHPRWLSEFHAHVGEVLNRWTENSLGPIDEAFGPIVQEATLVAFAGGTAVVPPGPRSTVPADAVGGSTAPRHEAKIPHVARIAVTQFSALRSLTTVVTGLLGFVATLVLAVLGYKGKADGPSKVNLDPSDLLGRLAGAGTWLAFIGAVVVASIMGAVMVLVGLHAWNAAGAERHFQIDQGRELYRSKVDAWLKDSTAGATQRHRSSLTRWLQVRYEEWDRAVDRWWSDVVEPAVKRAEADTERRAADTRAQVAQATAEIAACKAFRQRIATLSTELRRRVHDLSDDIAAAGPATAVPR